MRIDRLELEQLLQGQRIAIIKEEIRTINSFLREMMKQNEVFKKCLIQLFNSRYDVDLHKKIYEITLTAKDKNSLDIKDYFIADNIEEVYNYLIVSPDYEIKDIRVYEEDISNIYQ